MSAAYSVLYPEFFYKVLHIVILCLLLYMLIRFGYSVIQLQHHFGTVAVMGVINELHAVSNKGPFFF